MQLSCGPWAICCQEARVRLVVVVYVYFVHAVGTPTVLSQQRESDLSSPSRVWIAKLQSWCPIQASVDYKNSYSLRQSGTSSHSKAAESLKVIEHKY